MQISPVSAKTNALPSFGALLFKIDRTEYSKEGFIKQERNDKKFRDEFLSSLNTGDREAVESVEKWAKKNKLADILIERRFLTQDITISTKARKSDKPVEDAVIIGRKHSSSPIEEIDTSSPHGLIFQLGKCYTQAEVLKDELQQGR